MGRDYCNDALWVWILVHVNTGFYGILTRSMGIDSAFGTIPRLTGETTCALYFSFCFDA